MGKNAIVGQSGGPTSVINASLAGVFESCKSRGADIVYGMCNGVAGLLEERVVDLSTVLTDDLDIELLKRTPSSFLGSCRYKLPDWHEDETVYKKLFAILEKLKDGEVARSPGMKYKHYAPKADVTILKGSFDAYRDYIAAHAGNGVWALCFDGEEAQLPVPAISYGKEGDGISEAHNLFTVLRELDRKGAKTVYARCPLSDGVSMAVYNRLIRAAAFRVVEV